MLRDRELLESHGNRQRIFIRGCRRTSVIMPSFPIENKHLLDIQPIRLAHQAVDKPLVSIVWLKRDFRLHDHAPFHHAASNGAVLPLWVIEPDWWQSADMDSTHFNFALESARELRSRLREIGSDLVVQFGDILEIFSQLQQSFTIRELLSHEETGGDWTFQRDKRVVRWCRQNGITWKEYRQDGVIRRLKNRDGWAENWQRWADTRLLPAPRQLTLPEPLRTVEAKAENEQRWRTVDATIAPISQLQKGGEEQAHDSLATFLNERGANYRRGMSSPLTANENCSRLSPYIAWGCINVRQIYQAVMQTKAIRGADKQWQSSLVSYRSRLSWHCHFMQKLESEPSLEFQNLCRAYDGLRENDFSEERFQAWCDGRTGYPMIDACMRALREHRWINFRMRAMLVSFASYDLWLHWRKPALFLARHFLDYEPGIHYPQIQMQSGVTGINTIRIYSPEKQGKDQDPTGDFVRRYVPELRQVPTALIWNPSKLSRDEQVRYGCEIGRDYPSPIVDHAQAIREAKAKIYEIRQTGEAREKAVEVAKRHGSRKRRDVFPKPRTHQQLLLPGFDALPPES
jgi:deoxyribodipyrimidine photo-lyase